MKKIFCIFTLLVLSMMLTGCSSDREEQPHDKQAAASFTSEEFTEPCGIISAGKELKMVYAYTGVM